MPEKKSKSKHSLIGKIVIFFNYLFALCLILSGFAKHISPASLWIAAFVGISYPLFLVINFGFILAWLIRPSWCLLISLISIIFTLSTFNKYIAFHTDTNLKDKSNYIKILTYNVHNFDIYNYNKRWVSDIEKRNKIYDYFTSEKFDIICIQEFVDDKTGRFKTLDTLPSFLLAKNYHFDYTKNVRKLNYFGIATFSKYPIVNKGKILFHTNSNNICIYTDIKVNNKIIRVYNMHLQSIRFGDEDYKFATNIQDPNYIKNETKIQARSLKIMYRLKKAFVSRASQADTIAEHIRLCPYPVIICGDFNDTPSSYAYYRISHKLRDAFCESGWGFDQTYVGGSFPSFRIDYILHSKELKSFNYQKDNVTFSDHYPVKCYLRIN